MTPETRAELEAIITHCRTRQDECLALEAQTYWRDYDNIQGEAKRIAYEDVVEYIARRLERDTADARAAKADAAVVSARVIAAEVERQNGNPNN